MSLTDYELILGADLWTDQPEILSASVGFDGIIGVNANSADAVIAGGAWNSDLFNCSVTGEAPPTTALTSVAAPTGISLLYDCLSTPDHVDGFPVCFSWPILPSSVQRDYFQYTRSDGKVFAPNCISSWPNFEFNERHCVVLFDDFINRVLPPEDGPPAPLQDGLLYMSSLEIVGDLMLVGPQGRLVSALGLYRNASWQESSYVSGPVLTAARLAPSSELGEGGTPSMNRVATVVTANSGQDLFGNETSNGSTLYRLRLFYSGGMTVNGVNAMQPDLFDQYFAVVLKSGQTIELANLATSVSEEGVNGTLTVLGVADLGVRQAAYDECYVEDRDNYLDILISAAVSSSTSSVETLISQVTAVLAFGKGAALYNPGGPGRTPTPGTLYTAPAPANQTVPVRVDLNGTYQTTYCRSRFLGRVSTDPDTCEKWLSRRQLKTVSYGTQSGLF